MKTINNYPLFLPNVTNTYGKDTNVNAPNMLTDSRLRLKEARRALFSVLEKKYFEQIVIVDGSNTEILTKKEIDAYALKGIIIEQLLFQQNTFDVAEFGKSNGEMQITNYMVSNSILVKKAKGFTKITPRYFLDNIDEIIPKIYNKKNIFYLYEPSIIPNKNKFVCTIFYKTSVDFYKKYLAESIHECQKNPHGMLEAIFYRKLSKIKKTSVYTEFPHFSGLAGTTGKNIKNRYYFARNIFSKLGLLCYSFK